MDEIRPLSAKDCNQVVANQKNLIESKLLSCEIEFKWIPNITKENLALLAKGANIETRRLIASHPKTPESILSTMAEDKDESVLLNIAENPNSPSGILKDMVKTGGVALWRRLANSNRPPAEQEALGSPLEGGVVVGKPPWGY